VGIYEQINGFSKVGRQKKMKKKTVCDIDVKGKRVLVRVDFNVTVDDGFDVADDARIKLSIPTIEYLLAQGAKVVLCSHLGRPKGKVDNLLSLVPVGERLSALLGGRKVVIVRNFLNKTRAEKLISKNSLLLLENIRFYSGEELNEGRFAKNLADLADIFVNDGFGVSHRIHASTVGVAKYLPAVAGLLLEKEVKKIGRAVIKPKRPLVAIIGGAKAEDKIILLDKLLVEADCLIVGGGVANTFLKAWGLELGNSYCSYEMVELARKLMWKAMQSSTALTLPEDVVVGKIDEKFTPRTVLVDEVCGDVQILDIGQKTLAKIKKIVAGAGTIIWNGPVGYYEDKRFAKGTAEVLEMVAESAAYSVVGGGNTLDSMKDEKLIAGIDHISTGGGALLEFIEKGTLPAIEILEDK